MGTVPVWQLEEMPSALAHVLSHLGAQVSQASGGRAPGSWPEAWPRDAKRLRTPARLKINTGIPFCAYSPPPTPAASQPNLVLPFLTI